MNITQFITTDGSFTVTDNWNNTWQCIWNDGDYDVSTALWSSGSFSLDMTVPFDLQPTALSFTFDVILPAEGIIGGVPSSYAQYSQGNATFSIGLTRDSSVLNPQYIQYVQPVGAIYGASVKARASERIAMGGFDLNDTNTRNNVARRTASFELTVIASGSLQVGDVIYIYAPSYDFNYDSELVISTGSNRVSGRALAYNNTIALTVIAAVDLNTMRSGLSVTIDASASIAVPIVWCDANNVDCPMYVYFDSTTTPTMEFVVYPSHDYLIPYFEIHVHTAAGVPTPFPTGQPSGEPTGVPSSQPSFASSFDSRKREKTAKSHLHKQPPQSTK